MKSEEITGCIGVVVLAMALIVLGVVFNAWALKVLWGWFIVSTFGLSSLSIIEAMGVSLIVSFLITPYNKQEDDEETSVWIKAFVIACGRPLLAVGMGWIIVQFM